MTEKKRREEEGDLSRPRYDSQRRRRREDLSRPRYDINLEEKEGGRTSLGLVMPLREEEEKGGPL